MSSHPRHPTQEFNKKFRGSDDFKKSVAEDKIESFGKVLQKFFDTEREDYKKDAAAKIPDYDYLVKKAGQAGTSFAAALLRVVQVENACNTSLIRHTCYKYLF